MTSRRMSLTTCQLAMTRDDADCGTECPEDDPGMILLGLPAYQPDTEPDTDDSKC